MHTVCVRERGRGKERGESRGAEYKLLQEECKAAYKAVFFPDIIQSFGTTDVVARMNKYSV